jgi:lincosamide nucleotidyltransferase B/F
MCQIGYNEGKGGVVMKEQRLIERIDAIGHHLSMIDGALALVALGSIGDERFRLDKYSDLDFFVVVEEDLKETLIDDLSWLSYIHPLVYAFKNTKDGHKFLFADHIYGEFAVFSRAEIDHVTQARGRMIWKHPDYHNDNLESQKGHIPKLKRDSVEHAANEALTNIYVGLLRYHRGEKLSAQKLIEVHALNQVVSILHLTDDSEVDVASDLFALDRRVEERYPAFAKRLPAMLSGYARLGSSAKALLDYLQMIYPINTYMKIACERLIEELHTRSI